MSPIIALLTDIIALLTDPVTGLVVVDINSMLGENENDDIGYAADVNLQICSCRHLVVYSNLIYSNLIYLTKNLKK